MICLWICGILTEFAVTLINIMYVTQFVAISLHTATKQLSPLPLQVTQMDQKLNLITDMLHHLVSRQQGDQGNNRASQRGNNNVSSELFLPNNTLPTYEQLTVPGGNEDDISWCGANLGWVVPAFLLWTGLSVENLREMKFISQPRNRASAVPTPLVSKHALLKLPTVAKGLPGCLPPGKISGISTLILFLNKWSQLIFSQEDQNGKDLELL